ncbi:MAG: TetR/AcrR family transcriptional regulator [Muribaculaceae bacterium]|nr:TetR/AcrR family transcriptional regulator [Muribaculaceae bacterium]
MQKNNRKETLFNAAFKLFLLKQYKGVTLADIEKETGMTRGAIFYHAKNKEDLYRKVVKRYWIDRQNLKKKMDLPEESSSLKDFIYSYTASIAKTMNGLHSLLAGCTVQQASQAYLSFLMQLKQTAPDLHDEYLSNRTNELFIWNDVLRAAVASGEISEDIDTYAFAQTFLYVFYGQTFWEALDNGLNVELLRRNYLKIYDAIRVKKQDRH